MALDDGYNFGVAQVSGGYNATATSIVVEAGQGTALGPAPFNAVWWNATSYPNIWDDPNREIVRVTAINTDTLTIVRAQEVSQGGKTASTKNAAGSTYLIARVITAKTVTDLKASAIDIGAETVWVTEYGAAGDGVTDDTQAFVDAIAAGNLIHIPPGTYLVTGDIALKDNLELRGAGVGLTTIKMAASAGAKPVLKDPGSSLSNLTLTGLTIDGNDDVNSTGLELLTLENGCSQVRIDRCELKNGPKEGIQLSGTAGQSADVRIVNSRVVDCRGHLIDIYDPAATNEGIILSGLFLQDPGHTLGASQNKAALAVRGPALMSDLEIQGVRYDNYGINSISGGSVRVQNLQLEGAVDGGSTSKGVWFQTSDSVLIGGRILGGPSIGVHLNANNQLVQGVSITAGTDVDADGNNCRIVSCSLAGSGTGVVVQSGRSDVSILDNTITATTKVTNSGTNTHARNNVGWKTSAIVESSDEDANAGGAHTVTIAHGLDVTPSAARVVPGAYRSSGTGDFGLRGSWVKSTDGTNVVIEAYVTAAAASTNFRVTAFIDALP